jgi:aspartyl protease family protein
LLSLALRYLVVVIVVGGGFAMLQKGGWFEQAAANRVPRAEIARTAPPRISESDDGWEYVIEAGPHGHFVVEAMVEGVPILFLVDTGASDIVLTPEDARALGLEPRTLDFSARFRTANGMVRAAPVSLREVRLGQFSLYDLDAFVNEAPIGISLLGMRFLDRLAGYEVADGSLILRW